MASVGAGAGSKFRVEVSKARRVLRSGVLNQQGWRTRKQRISMFKFFTKRVKEARNRLVVIHPHCLCHFLELKVIYALSQLFLSTQQLASQYLKVDRRGGKRKKKMYNEVFVIIETDLYEICVYFRNYYIINSCI